jgi:hypothetical protein
MISMHMADQYHVNLAKPGVVRAGNGTAGIVKYAGTIGVFEYHRTIKLTELTLLAAKRGNFHIRGHSRLAGGNSVTSSAKTDNLI